VAGPGSKLGSGFQVGPAHAGKIADVTAEADTFRIFAEPGVNMTAPGRWRPFTSAGRRALVLEQPLAGRSS
jgi:hypothetical protein